MSPKQIKQMRDTAIAFLSIIVCYGIIWVAIEVEKHKSAYKLTNYGIIHKTLK